VPVNPAFASLNLAQCVLLLAYEWRRHGVDVVPEVVEMAGTRRAESIEVQKLTEALEARLDSVGFFWPDHKAESMIGNLRNMVSRLPLTEADVRIFHGIIKSLADKHPKSR